MATKTRIINRVAALLCITSAHMVRRNQCTTTASLAIVYNTMVVPTGNSQPAARVAQRRGSHHDVTCRALPR